MRFKPGQKLIDFIRGKKIKNNEPSFDVRLFMKSIGIKMVQNAVILEEKRGN